MYQIRSIVTRLGMAGAVLGLSAVSVLSAPVTSPPGLNPGDQYRLAFVTSSAIANAQSTSISTYNSFVTGVANSQPALVALGTTWTAIASTASVDARDNTGTNPSGTGVPIYLLDGTQLAANNADLWDGTLLHALNVTEAGSTQGSVLVWTGTASDGTGYNNVNVKQLGSVTGFAAGGSNASTSATWMVAGGFDTVGPLPLYAMSGVLTVVNPAVPPAIAKSFGETVVSLDNPVTTMTVTLSNPGVNTIPLTGVGFTDIFPTGLVVDTPNGLTNSCGGTVTATAGSGSLTLSGATLAVGETCTVSIVVRATTAGTLVNTTGAVTSTEAGSGLTSSASLQVVPTVPALGGRELMLLAILLAVLGAMVLGSKPSAF